MNVDVTNNIKNISENEPLFHHYQPIYILQNYSRFGYESLLRLDTDPLDIFKQAKNAGQLFELDTLSIFHSIKRFCENDHSSSNLFVNVFPLTVCKKEFIYFLINISQQFPINRRKIVLEIIETDDSSINIATLLAQLNIIKELGFSISINDVGKNPDSFKKMTLLQPEFIKLNQFLFKDLAVSENKQKMIESFLQYCGEDITLILQGIEEPIELATAKMLGIQLGQGNILGKPQNL